MLTKKTTLLLLKNLEKIISDKALHSRWLNTLSYLEYIGARKMLKSLPAPFLNKSLLEHINEEARHSFFFKSLAKKTAGADMSFKDEELIAPQAARAYFQEVDHFGLKFSNPKEPLLNYLYTTYAVEQRALSVYPLYNDLLSGEGFSFSLNSVLNDEKEHLDCVWRAIQKTDPNWDKHLEELRGFEHQKYFGFLIAMEKELFEAAYFQAPAGASREESASYNPKN